MNTNADEKVKILQGCVATHIFPYRALLLAFSGGLDSTVLLDALVTLRDDDRKILNRHIPTLRVIHIHHGLSCHADLWAEDCAKKCKQYNVIFSTVRITVKATREGIEAAARNARYQALNNMLVKNEILLTAQHQNDQTETLLLALKRGSGPAGLAGMGADMLFHNTRLVRPFLEFSRSDLESYAHIKKLNWVEDDSNKNLRFDRNFLRQKIIPSLQQRWPKFSSSVARCAQLCAEQEKLVNELLTKTLDQLIKPDGSLYVTDLIKMSDIKRRTLLRLWLSRQKIRMPTQKQLRCLWEEVALSRRDAIARIQLNKCQIRKFRNYLYVLPEVLKSPDKKTVLLWAPTKKWLNLPEELGTIFLRCFSCNNITVSHSQQKMLSHNPCSIKYYPYYSKSSAIFYTNIFSDINLINKTSITENNKVSIVNTTNANVNGDSTNTRETTVRAPLHDEEVSIRFGQARGLLHITERHRGRKLKKIWQELNIPPWQRDCIPLLFYNDQLIAAIGCFITREGAILQSQEKWHFSWLQKNIK